MLRPRSLHVLGAIAVVITAVAVTVTGGGSWIDGVFLVVLLAALVLVGALAARALREAARVRAHAAALAATEPDAAARQAVLAERLALAVEIEASLRAALLRIRTDAAGARPLTASATLRRIHQDARDAAIELRRRLGLLRDQEHDRLSAAVNEEPATVRTIRPRDIALGAGLLVVGVVEASVLPLAEGREPSTLAVLLTGLAAVTIVGRGAVPGYAALACACVLLVGFVAGTPVVSGFWCIATIGSLLWTIAARPEASAPALTCGALLAATAGITSVVADPENAALMIALIGVATLAGLAVRVGRVVARRAARRADAREAEIRDARIAAVEAERIAFARELHDVISHAIGVIAVQAGAAQVSMGEPDAVARSLAVIRETADRALVELDRLGADPAGTEPSDMDAGNRFSLDGLVGRITAAGTTVALHGAAEVPPALAPTVHRIVQEALTNVVRHAHGAHAVVEIGRLGDELTVRVSDDGPGVDDAGHRRGYGLIGLAERVEFTGGTFASGPSPEGRGFTVTARLPMQAVEPQWTDRAEAAP